MLGSYRVSLFAKAPDKRPSLSIERVFDKTLLTGELYAFDVFLDFILGPYYADLGRCARCQNYFVNTSGRKKRKYCSQLCASFVTAKESTRKRLRAERESKRASVQKALDAFCRRPEAKRSDIDWKKWVANKAGPEVTTNFVTRLLNEGKLKLPKLIADRLMK